MKGAVMLFYKQRTDSRTNIGEVLQRVPYFNTSSSNSKTIDSCLTKAKRRRSSRKHRGSPAVMLESGFEV